MDSKASEQMAIIESLRDEVRRLSDRLAALEAAIPKPAAEVRSAPPVSKQEELSEETLAAIGAAIAAYLGVKPHSRQIRLVGAASWVQQGRVTIQASHALTVRQP